MTKLLKIVEKVNQGNTGGYLNSFEDPFETGSTLIWASLVAQMVKNPPAMHRTSVPSPPRSPGGGPGNPPQYSCLENPHGQMSLVGYSPWGHKESDMT